MQKLLHYYYLLLGVVEKVITRFVHVYPETG